VECEEEQIESKTSNMLDSEEETIEEIAEDDTQLSSEEEAMEKGKQQLYDYSIFCAQNSLLE